MLRVTLAYDQAEVVFRVVLRDPYMQIQTESHKYRWLPVTLQNTA